MTLIADVFRKIPAPKNMVRKISKKPCFRGPLERQHGKWAFLKSILNFKHLPKKDECHS